MIDVISARKRILEIAIHGNLVPNTNDESSQESVSNNIETRAKLVKQKLTKEPKVKPMITEGTFDIPNSWIWVPLGDLCILLSRGKSPRYSDNEKYPIFAQKCNQPNGLALEKALFLDETTLEKWPEYFRLRDKDIVINSTGTGTVGRVGFYVSDALSSKYPFIVPDSHVTVVRVGENIMPEYVFYALRSTSIQKIMFNQFRGSTNQKEFYIDSVYSIPIPLPPLAEQKRIVERVEEIFRLLDTINQAQERYSADSQILKAKLITAGIQGKLTKQLPSDGTAEELYQQIQAEKQKLIKEGKLKKEKPLPPVSPEEVPFEIPGNWMWVRLGEVSINVQYGSSKKSSPEGKIPVIRMGNLQNGRIIYDKLVYTSDDEEIERYQLEYNDLLFNRTNSLEIVGKTAIYKAEMPAIYAGYLVRITPLIDSDYLNFVMQSQYYWKYCESVRSDSIGQSNINAEKLKNFPVLMPPLAEQKRIADVLERALGELE